MSMKTIFWTGTAIATMAWAGAVSAQEALPTITDAIGAGHLILDVRARYENVQQAGMANQANAETIRTQLGWETGAWHGVQGVVEFEDVRGLGPQDYNVAIPGPGGASLNGKTAFPIVNDPDVTELNRLQLAWTPSDQFSSVVGRQRILLDDQRFVGNVGWRQDEQTFDGARADFGWGRLKATYVYVTKVNRIFGQAKDWDSDSHLFNAAWSPAEAFKLEGFVYALDFSNSAANSSITTGAKATGKVKAGPVQLTYGATVANQKDWRNNPAHYNLDYYEGDVAGTIDIWTARLGYEQLDGNGTVGFSTPLGTTHAFQGWADAFATTGGNKTGVDGVKDLNVSLILQPKFKFKFWSKTQVTVTYHDFNAQRTGADLASEWDAQITAALTPKLTFLVKYAEFTRDPVVPVGTTLAPADRRKAWVSLEYRF
jgi:hypothetical protein